MEDYKRSGRPKEATDEIVELVHSVIMHEGPA